MNQQQLKQLKSELNNVIRPILERHGIEAAYQSKLVSTRFGKITFAFETSTKESARIRLNGWRFLLTDDESKELDHRQPFMLNGAMCTVVDFNPQRMETAPWVVESEIGARTFVSTSVLRECLSQAQNRTYAKSRTKAVDASKNYATWG